MLPHTFKILIGEIKQSTSGRFKSVKTWKIILLNGNNGLCITVHVVDCYRVSFYLKLLLIRKTVISTGMSKSSLLFV